MALITGFLVRAFLITETLDNDRSFDLNVYQSGALLIKAGVNPYNHTENPELRAELRGKQAPYNSWISESQDRWNYYASGNLPMSLLFYRGVELAVGEDPRLWRLVFAVFDSAVGAIGVWYVLRFWGELQSRGIYWIAMIGLALAAWSPVFLTWGTAIPEDKGVQILLMVAALVACRSDRLFLRLGFGAFALGCSISFKLLGVFLVPLCFVWAVRPEEAEGLGRRLGWFSIGLAAGLLIWFVPFGLAPVEMIARRIQADTGAHTQPLHASMWRYFAVVFPERWPEVRTAFLVCFAGTVGLGLWRRIFDLRVGTAIALCVAVAAISLTGSLDRIHIGFLVAILLLGEAWGSAVAALLKVYLIGGFAVFFRSSGIGMIFLGGVRFPDPEYLDSLFCAVFMLCLFGGCVGQLLEGWRGVPSNCSA